MERKLKKKIVDALLDSGEAYLSGEQLSQLLGVSRTAIWKHIKQLKEEGYEIESVTNRGYKLIKMPNDYNGFAIERALKENKTLDRFIQDVYYFDCIDSTNQYAKSIALSSGQKNCLIVADEQTAGKGRLGRHWESQKGQGIWMSLLLKPEIAPENASYLTQIAAVAMARAVEEVTGIDTLIKWPNDLILNQRKVCGILTELNAEINLIHYLVIGIGLNVSQQVFEGELTDKAIALNRGQTASRIDRLKIIQMFVVHFETYYNQFVQNGQLLDVVTYAKSHSATLNKRVHLITRDQSREVFAKDLDAFGRLIVVNEQNEEETVVSGEVSVRGLNGYI